MGLIVLEALAALLALCFVVWWTMFSGRQGGELDAHEAHTEGEPPRDDPTGR